jgi:hypothetical protein
MPVISTPEGIQTFQLLARWSGLKLEVKGMTRHGRSVYSIVKELYGFKGSKVKVLAQYENYLRGIGVLA